MAEPLWCSMQFCNFDRIKLLFNRHLEPGHERQQSLNHVDHEVREGYQVIPPALPLEQHCIDARHNHVPCELVLLPALNVLTIFCKIIEAPVHVNEYNSRCCFLFLLSRATRANHILLLNQNVFKTEIVINLAGGVQLLEAIDQASAHLTHCVQGELVFPVRNEIKERLPCFFHHNERVPDCFAIRNLRGLGELTLPRSRLHEVRLSFDSKLAAPNKMQEAVP